MLDLIALGDVTEDIFLQISHSAKLECNAKHHSCEICFPFGIKLGAERVDKLFGGNAGNVAIGTSRLGLKSGLYAQAGQDQEGKTILQQLKKEKVSTKYFYLNKEQKTNYSVVLDFKGERTILVHHEPRSYHFPSLEPTKWIYLTSMGKGSEILFPPLLCYLKKNRTKLAFNPGSEQLNLGLRKLLPLLKKCQVIILNTEEAQQLLNTSERNFIYLTKKINQLGIPLVVITDGNNGSYAYDGNNLYYCPIYKVPLIEKTGSGDAFAAGFICALLYHQSLTEALRWGSINAASVIQRIGPQEGLIKLSLLKKILTVAPQFRPRLFTGKEVTDDKIYYPKKYTRF